MLHVIYRSYGGENRKGRPAFYSKVLALGSVVRAVREVRSAEVELIYLNDGPIPADRLKIMEKTGEVVAGARMGNVGSLRAAFTMPAERSWKPDDMIWFAEDDYLYKPQALENLTAAAQNFSDADYFGLYALIGERQPNGQPPEDRRVPAQWRGGEPRLIQGETWRRALSTTSTFGAWVRTVAEDRNMMFAAMRCGAAFDHSKCLAYQGYNPYPLWYLSENVRAADGAQARIRAAAIAVVRGSFNIYAAVRRLSAPRRTLVASDPALITHMEADLLAAGSDWEAEAAGTQAWMVENGLLVDAMEAEALEG